MRNPWTWCKHACFVLFCAGLTILLSHSTMLAADPPVTTGRWFVYNAATPNYPGAAIVNAMAEDSLGRLWIGTDNLFGTEGLGAAMFDGYTWTPFTVANTAGGLRSDTVYSITPLGNTLWFGGPNGFSIYNVSNGVWSSYSMDNGMTSNDARNVVVPNAVVGLPRHYFGTSDKGVLICNLTVLPGDPIDCSQSESQENGLLPSNLVNDMAVAGADRWVVTGAGVVRVRTPLVGAEQRTKFLNGTPGCPDIDRANSIALDYAHNRVWVSLGAFALAEIDFVPNQGRGACVFDTVSESWRTLNAGNSGISEDDVVDVSVDREGRAWFGALGDAPGVFVYTPVTDTCCWQTYRTTTPGSQLPVNPVRTVFAGYDRVWFGHPNALSSLALHWQHFGRDVTALASLPGALWVGTATELATFDGTTFTTARPSVAVRDILAVSANEVWVATNTGLHRLQGNNWRQFTTANSGIASNDLLSVAKDSQGRIWAGSAAHGVSVFNGSGNNWATFNTGNVLASNIVRDIATNGSGDVWLATEGGVSHFDGSNWRTFSAADGLPATLSRAVGIDANGIVWAGTPQGAASWDGAAWTNHTGQMPAIDVLAIHAPASGGVWFNVILGALYYDGAWDFYRASNSGLTHSMLPALTSDGAGGVWFGGPPFTGAGSGPGGLFVRHVSAEPLGVEVPAVSSISPTSGPANTLVTITGSLFQPGSTVYFGANGGSNGVYAQVVSQNATQIVARVPSNALLGKVRVFTGQGAATSTEDFAPLPVITSIEPTSGPVGVPVKVKGTNLASLGFSEVKFGNSAYSSINNISASPFQIEVVVPADASDGAVMVKTSSGEASGPLFTLSGGGLKLLDWEVHQGLPQYQRLVTGKSTVVRLFLGSDAPSGCAYVSGATLQLLGPGGSHINMAETLSTGGIPNKGYFCGMDKQHAKGGSVDFVIPRDYTATGITNMAISLNSRTVPVLTKVLGNYAFEPTDDLRVHIAAPGWQHWDDPNVYGPLMPNQTGSHFFNRQIESMNRVYPVRDGTGDMLSENGFRFLLNPAFTLCNGVDDGFCKNASDTYSYLYDFWQENTAGILRYCMVQTRFPSNAKDDGSVLSWHYGEIKPNAEKRIDFIVAQRPGQNLPGNPLTLVSFDTGSPDLVITSQSLVVTFNGPMGCPAYSDGDLFMIRTIVKNQGTESIKDHTIRADYNETVINTLANGGLVMGIGDVPNTYVQRGPFFIIDGAQGDMFDPPMDNNYNGVIDNEDKALSIAEFDDWDPTLGVFFPSQNMDLVGPRDVLRNFIDENDNQAADPSDDWAPSLERHRDQYVRYAAYDVPGEYRTAFNQMSPVDAQFSQLWLWNRANPMGFMGLGGQAVSGQRMWAMMDSNTAIIHETGHNLGLSHSAEGNIPNIPSGYNTFDRKVVLADKLKSGMADPVTGPVEEVFFNPLQYHHLFVTLRAQFAQSAVQSASALQAPVIHLAGQISLDGVVTLNTSYRSDQLATTPLDPAGSYWLRLVGGGAILADYRFGVEFAVEDLAEGEAQPQSAPFEVTQPWVEGTQSVEIWDSSGRLLQLPVSASPPTVVVQSPNGGESVAADGTLTVQWSGSDPDGDALTYAVFYSADGGTTWLTLAAATQASQLSLSAADLPGSANALVEVRVSDGVHSASDRSDGSFQVAAKGPLWASIFAPEHGAALVQSQIHTLVGGGYDLEDGPLPSNRLAWFSDQVGSLGTGEAVTVSLPVGVHVLTLVANDSAFITTSTSITVEVLADFDGDGLADAYEEQYGELAWWNGEDAGADSDGDGLTNRSEEAWGTHPGNGDSDGDGVSDGDEAAAGVSPTDAASKPQAARVLVSAQQLSLAMAAGGANPAPTNLLVMSSAPDVLDWSASADVAWLKLDMASGQTPAEVMLSVDGAGLAVGQHQGLVTFQGGAAPWTVAVTLAVADPAAPPLNPTPDPDPDAEQQLHLPVIAR